MSNKPAVIAALEAMQVATRSKVVRTILHATIGHMRDAATRGAAYKALDSARVAINSPKLDAEFARIRDMIGAE